MTDTESKLRQRTDGRLDRSRDPAILNAALAALAEYGYDATNMNDIAARAGVGKAAIYRRWASKAALITDALVYWRPDLMSDEAPDTGSLTGDFELLVERAARNDDNLISNDLMLQPLRKRYSGRMRLSRLSSVLRIGVALLALGAAAFIFPRVAVADPGFQPCAGCSSNDSTEDFPIPRRMIATTCTAEQILAAARDFEPVYYQRYMADYDNHQNVAQATQDKAHWFYSLSSADRRAYSANFYAPQIDPLNLAWPNHMKIFFNNKGVVAKETENCADYPAGDMSVWNW